MNSEIKRQGQYILVHTDASLTHDEAIRIAKRVQALLFVTANAKLIFSHSGKLALEIKNYQLWETMLSCLNLRQVKAVSFRFERENRVFQILAQEYARRAAVPCFQYQDKEELAFN